MKYVRSYILYHVNDIVYIIAVVLNCCQLIQNLKVSISIGGSRSGCW